MEQQTAVEWLEEQFNNPNIPNSQTLFNQAKEMEKQQQDEFAKGFAEWLLIIYNEDIIYDAYTKKELLEIYKKEEGL